METLDMTEEEFLPEDLLPAEADALKETWPLPVEETVREFENWLLDIGVRI